jgi:hypothetical protein
MSVGDMWWARNTWTSNMPDGVSFSTIAEGFRFVGSASTSPSISAWLDTRPPPPWRFYWTARYFLDPPRMPSAGTPFVAMPSVRLGGSLALFGGPPGREVGLASWSLALAQRMTWDDEDEVSYASTSWQMGRVYGKNVERGKQAVIPQKRDFGPVFFNLDRSRTLIIDLDITLTWNSSNTGLLVFNALDVEFPPWSVRSLD